MHVKEGGLREDKGRAAEKKEARSDARVLGGEGREDVGAQRLQCQSY